ncbi:MAG: adenylyltransferase/cytidyltransferase family protein [Candidatus Falkowbacteria bacterium]
MKTIYVYPGTFCPPTLGHLNIVRQAAALFPELTILCSENPNKKDNWFTPEECRNLWSSYTLPQNVRILTFTELQKLKVKNSKIVMIRGLRGANDFEAEKEVMFFNRQHFGINKFFYILGAKKYKDVSSSRVRLEANDLNLKNLSHQVSPLIISALLEKSLELKNVFLVVGQPGAGKSTFLKIMKEININNFHINTDDFNQQLKPLLKAEFGEEDLIQVAIKNEKAMKKVIAHSWFKLLNDSLKSTPTGANVFIEIPYGLQVDKLMFRFVGGKIIHIGCDDENKNLERVIARGTPQLAEFIKRIPNKEITIRIVKKYKLKAAYINTNCSLETLFEKAKKFNNLISGGLKNDYHL